MRPITRLLQSSHLRLSPPHQTRSLHSTTPARASVLFALHALSNSRETQHFNKLSSLHRKEHSPPLKLIQTGEIDPFPLPNPPKTALSSSTSPSASFSRGSLSPQLWDRQALATGRAILAANARHAHRLSRSLARARAREARLARSLEDEQIGWRRERARLRHELRAAGFWIVTAVGVATGFAMWRFWPEGGNIVVGAEDSGRMGRRIAEAAGRTETGERAFSGSLEGVGAAVGVAAGAPVAVVELAPAKEVEISVKEPVRRSGSWWEGLFWKQS